jgi:lysophospholipase L1-like esterase
VRRPLRRPLLLATLACVLAASLAFASTPPAPRRLLLSLGDSIANGTEPSVAHRPAKEGYAEVLERRLGRELTVLGQGGATTASVLSGGQLARAVAFLRAHAADHVVVTIAIGANDVERCSQGGTFPTACVAASLQAVQTNLPIIVRRLRAAAGPHVMLVGLTYYDAFLAHWREAASGRAYLQAAVPVERAMNATIAAAYREAHVRVADVARDFRSEDFRDVLTLPGYGRLPLAVARICSWTWACTVPDDHPNARGYRRIAALILHTLPARLRVGAPETGGASAPQS